MTAPEEDPADVATRHHESAVLAREAGDFAAAEAAARQAVEGFEAALGPASPDLASALVEWGRALQLVDRFAEAETALRRANDILAPYAPGGAGVGDGVSREVADELFHLAVIARMELAGPLRNLGLLAAAEQACREALSWYETRGPAKDPLRCTLFNQLGVIHKFQGRLAEAEAAYARALELSDPAREPDQHATLLHNLGGLAHARGEHARGEPLARRSVELRTALLGADHPATAADRAAWGALLEGAGRVPEAERAYAEALAVFERHLGSDSLEVSSALTALGGAWRVLDRLDDAERAYRRAAGIREQKLGPDHVDLAMTLNNLGMLLGARAHFDEALTLVRRAATIFEARLGAAHAHTTAARNNVAALLTAATAAAEARPGAGAPPDEGAG